MMRFSMGQLAVGVSGWMLVFGSAAMAADGKKEMPGGEGQVVLDTRSVWRAFVALSDPQNACPTNTAAERGTDKGFSPQDGWASPDFDDTGWIRMSGPVYGGYGFQQPVTPTLLLLRGRFTVESPSKVRSLRFSCAYRGGVVLYLNGKEVRRANLPGDKLEGCTPAEGYPVEAYVSPEGSLLRFKFGDPEKYKDRCETRIRRLSDIELPLGELRPGVNVLAIEGHRAPVNEIWHKAPGEKRHSTWSQLGLVSAQLKAQYSGGIATNPEKPCGLHVWNADPSASVLTADQVDPNESLGPVRIVGTRGGVFSGQVVAGSDSAVRGLKVAAGALAMPDGQGSIPASNILIRYGVPGGHEKGVEDRYPGRKDVSRFDGLVDEPPAECVPKGGCVVQPVWITVRIPVDAKPGEYRGKIAVGAEGSPNVETEVRLTVCDFKLPASRRFGTHIGLIQSPESEALQYDVPMWSDKHFELIDRAFGLMGEVGAKAVILPLIARHHFGKESMVRWIKKGDGSFVPDYSHVDRYMDIVQKHIEPDVVCLYLWDHCYSGGGYFGNNQHKAVKPMKVTAFDPATKHTDEIEIPAHGTPEGEAFWKPVLEELHARFAKRGIGDDVLMVGMASDMRPGKADTDSIKAAAPWAKWVLHSHGLAGTLNGVPVGHAAHVWGTKQVPDPGKARRYGWKRLPVITVFPRTGANPVTLFPNSMLGEYAMAGEALLMADFRGVGRIGADFWPVLKDVPGKSGRPLVAAYASWSQMGMENSVLSVLAPGEKGPIATVRYEMLRQGVQEAEARIFLEKVLSDRVLSESLGKTLSAKAQAVLDDRATLFLMVKTAWEAYSCSDLSDRRRRLFSVAGEVAGSVSK